MVVETTSTSLVQKVQEENREYVSVIMRNARRLQRLSEDILDITRIESKSLKLNKQSFIFVKTIREIIQDYATEIRKLNPEIIISFFAPEELGYIDSRSE